MDFPNWQLHRGYWKKGVRENTMAAFQQAFTAGCEMVELDVQISRDGVPHVFHDFSLKKFFHIDQWVNRTPSEDLKGLNIPTLQEVLESELVPEYLNIEIKSIEFLAYKVARKVCDVLQASEHDKKLMVSSFNPMALHWIYKIDPSITRALIVGDPKYLMSWKFKMANKWAVPDYINCNYKLIDEKETRERITSFEKPVMVWTVNDMDKAQFYLQRGARSIISDHAPPERK